MIDYFLQFASRNAAKTDPDIAEHYDQLEDLFNAGMVMTSPKLKFWRDSQDVAGTDGEGNPTVTHTYLPGFYILVSLPNVVNKLVNHSAVQLVLDVEKINERDWSGILKRNVTVPVLKDLRWSPVWAGRKYPWGAFD